MSSRSILRQNDHVISSRSPVATCGAGLTLLSFISRKAQQEFPEALLTFPWVAPHGQVRVHAVLSRVLAYHSQRRSRREGCANYEGMAAGARGRAHGDRVGGPGARRGKVLIARVRRKEGAALLTVSASLSGPPTL
jgi:hypothetical protein